jgi:hypothetical protein
VIVGISFNLILYYWLQMRKALKRQAEIKKAMEEGEALALSKRLIPQLQGNIDVTNPDSVNP